VGTRETVTPSRPLKVGRARGLIRKQSLKLRQRARERQIVSLKYVDNHRLLLVGKIHNILPVVFVCDNRISTVITTQRIKQHFFRRAVLSSYRGRCCMCGVSDPRLLVASHIVPWSKDKANRLNPSNGLCLSAIHDRAFDKGLITLTDDFKIVVSKELKRKNEPFIMEVLLPLNGRTIEPPERFAPQAEFIAWHRKELFVDNRK